MQFDVRIFIPVVALEFSICILLVLSFSVCCCI